MGAQGTATLDFGAFPGKSDASVAVTGQAGILSGSLVEAWIEPADTVEHTHDEHLVETLSVKAGSVVAGTGFTVYGVNTNQISEPLCAVGPNGPGPVDAQGPIDRGGDSTLLSGRFNIGWVWN